MEYRIERDTMGEVKVPADKYWEHKLREAVTISKSVTKKCRLNWFVHLHTLNKLLQR